MIIFLGLLHTSVNLKEKQSYNVGTLTCSSLDCYVMTLVICLMFQFRDFKMAASTEIKNSSNISIFEKFYYQNAQKMLMVHSLNKSINFSEEVLKESQCYYNCNLKRHKINLVQWQLALHWKFNRVYYSTLFISFPYWHTLMVFEAFFICLY